MAGSKAYSVCPGGLILAAKGTVECVGGGLSRTKLQKFNAGADPQEFHNGSNDLRDVQIHGIYVELDAANDCAREIYDSIIPAFRGGAAIVTETLENSMANFLVETNDEENLTYSISIEARLLN